jgi:uncharacterized protein
MAQKPQPANTDGNEDWRKDILWRRLLPITAPVGHYPGFAPGHTLLKAGSTFAKRGRRLEIDLDFDRDTEVQMRDGVTIYVDVYRPAGATAPLPAIVAWSPYGKGNGGNQSLDDFPFRASIPRDRLSGLQMWEGPDPAWWCARGYAVVNVDARGAYMSEGRMAFWGTQEGRDGHDLVEWIARQPWSNGCVGLTGNSWLAVAQWFIAAERPPHLTAIAPWEASYDAFRSNFPGGIIDTAFPKSIFSVLVGNGETEDMTGMAKRQPLMSSYWQDKIAEVERIEIPAYVVGSWTNPVHSSSTFEAWTGLASHDKWLRVHNTMEWPDYYAPSSQQDLLRFFDRYLKGIDNGWENTPRVRLAVLGAEGNDELNRAVPEFPLPDLAPTALHLDSERNTIESALPVKIEQACCNGPSDSQCFDWHITEACELIGFVEARLWVQLRDATDQDFYIAIERLDRHGKPIAMRTIPLPARWIDRVLRLVHRTGRVPMLNMFFPSRFQGKLRLSHREVDTERSLPLHPIPSHRAEAPVKPGEIVLARIAISPAALRLERGQTLRLRIASCDLAPVPLPGLKHDEGKGSGCFSVWSGGEYDSQLLLPLRPVERR